MPNTFPAELCLNPVSRWPLRLPEATLETVLGQSLPKAVGDRVKNKTSPAVSIIVVSYNNLVFNRLCLESVLANTSGTEFELIVVDNGSSDGTGAYLKELAGLNARIKILFNEKNLGFAAACNRGLSVACGDVLVLLNNDTIVPPNWLIGLLERLQDPSVGMAGPVTNRCGNEAQIEVTYSTYGELVAFSHELGRIQKNQTLELPMLIMFCVAFRKNVYEIVGSLDERYEVGLFEDEDYCIRLTRAGFRMVCAEDVFVHHFGQASIGKLAGSSAYGELFHRNRRKFEEKWGLNWTPHRQRRSVHYQELVSRVQHTIDATLPYDANVLVVSRGDDDLLTLAGRTASHFPNTPDGLYAGYHPRDSTEAIEHLEKNRQEGSQFLVIPASMLWWLEYYPEFAGHMARHYPFSEHEGACLIYQLTDTPVSGLPQTRLAEFECETRPRLSNNLVTVIFPARGKTNEIRRFVEKFLRYSIHPHRLLLISDGNSSRPTRQFLREMSERWNHVVLATTRERLTRVAAINLGLRLAPGDVVIAGSQAEPDFDWLEIMCARAMGQSNVATVTSTSVFETPAQAIPRAPPCIFITRSALRRVGLLDERRFSDFNEAWLEFRERTRTTAFLDIDDNTDSLKTQPGPDQSTLLFIAHSGVGGVRFHSEDLAHAMSRSFRCLLLRAGPGSWSLHEVSNGNLKLVRQYRFCETWRPDVALDAEREQVVASISQTFAIDLVNVHHLLCTGPGLIKQLKQLGLPVVFSFHDFYALCPTSHLMDGEGNFCAGTCTPGLGECPVDKKVFKNGIPNLKHAYVHQHRDGMNHVLCHCDACIAPSHTTVGRLVESLPSMRADDFHVVAHGTDLKRKHLAVTPPKQGPAKIVCPGNLNVAKGLNLIGKLMELNAEHGQPFEFHFLGGVPGHFRTRANGGIFHGSYERNECLERLALISPSFSLLASVCEETFSYTLSESWAAGLPVFASDRGALKERIEHQGGGWLFDPEDPVAFYSGMLAVLRSPGSWHTEVENISRIDLMSIDREADLTMQIFRRCLPGLQVEPGPASDMRPTR